MYTRLAPVIMAHGRDSSNFLEGRRLDNGPNVRCVETSMEPSRLLFHRAIDGLLILSSWAVILIPLQPGLFVRPLGVRKNALSGSSEEIAQLIMLDAGKPD